MLDDLGRIVTGVTLARYAVKLGRRVIAKRGQQGPPPTDAKVARNLVIFLEDRRALYDPFAYEVPEHVKKSVFQIRQALIASRQDLGTDSKAMPLIRSMQDACRKYLGAPYSHESLANLRQQFHIDLKHLCTIYDIASPLPNRIQGSMYGPLGLRIRRVHRVPAREPGLIDRTKPNTKRHANKKRK